MLGWKITLYRLSEPNPLLAVPDVPALTAILSTDSDRESLVAGLKRGKRIAVWQTSFGGLDWLDVLVERQQALLLERNGGYPYVYVGRSEHLIPPVVGGPPDANPNWGIGEGYVVLPGWEGKTVIDHAEAQRSDPVEWLLVVAWDES